MCGTVRLQWGGGFSEGSFVAYPFYHLLERGFLAVHEDAYTIYLGTECNDAYGSGIQQDKR